MKSGKLFAMLALSLSAAIDNRGKPVYRELGNGMNPDYRREKKVQIEKEFDINGTRVMAYSRKDAIKRIRHKKGR